MQSVQSEQGYGDGVGAVFRVRHAAPGDEESWLKGPPLPSEDNMTPLGENYREYHAMTAVKATWGDGPWRSEPDKAQWIDAETGLDCLIVRNRHGSLCGYVGVPEGHPNFAEDYDDVDVNVHGGLTFSELCLGVAADAEATEICHVPAAGRPDHVWWFGFDCAHAFDLAPGMEALLRSVPNLPQREGDVRFHDTYRDWEYVVGEVRHLAKQLHGR